MKYFRQLRERRILPLIEEQKAFYDSYEQGQASQQWQLEQFNKVWSEFSKNVPRYKKMLNEGAAPVSFDSWEEFSSILPVMTKQDIQHHRDELTDQSRPPDGFAISGGSTGQPTQIPGWAGESNVSTRSSWYGRDWLGIQASDRLFLIWGHSHLLGTGFKGIIKKWERRLRDSLTGYFRCSAYQMDEESLIAAGRKLLRFKPRYAIGYAAALDRFARVNASMKEQFHRLRMKAVIATAESFPRSDSRDAIAELFGCPVLMEYGTSETGPIAQESKPGAYQTYWRYFMFEAVQSQHVPNAKEILITSLYPRCFPLVRYNVGDLVTSQSPLPNHGVIHFEQIIGRSNDVFTLPTGDVVHSVTVTHAFKSLPIVEAYQIEISHKGKHASINYQAQRDLNPGEIKKTKERLSIINASLADLSFKRVDQIATTVAGKTPLIVRVDT